MEKQSGVQSVYGSWRRNSQPWLNFNLIYISYIISTKFTVWHIRTLFALLSLQMQLSHYLITWNQIGLKHHHYVTHSFLHLSGKLYQQYLSQPYREEHLSMPACLGLSLSKIHIKNTTTSHVSCNVCVILLLWCKDKIHQKWSSHHRAKIVNSLVFQSAWQLQHWFIYTMYLQCDSKHVRTNDLDQMVCKICKLYQQYLSETYIEECLSAPACLGMSLSQICI